MKTIGLIGGMSWESTVPYYKVINEVVRQKLGGLHSAKIILYSVNFEEIVRYELNDEWDKCAEIVGDAAKRLELAGADFIFICCNTMHEVVSQIQEKINIPIVHIVDPTADKLEQANISNVALLGTKYTMTRDFYKSKLIQRGLNVIVPSEDDIEILNNIIFNELCLGVIKEESKLECKRIIEVLGAEGVILGCTELGLLVKKEDSSIPLFDTTIIHATKAAEMAIS